MKHWIKIGIAGFAAGLCNGFFGSGGGTIVVPAMVHLLGMKEHDAHATALAVILPLTAISSFVYFRGGFFQWDVIWKVAAGGAIGGLIGAWILNRISPYWLRKVFGLFMIIAAIRMIT
ncbi:MAG: sulfite exporter TauE/SafE family protein [Clostridia bacterium]|nr:sulfite exporter TauE/SafE family protein [Clostridia bacterium]